MKVRCLFVIIIVILVSVFLYGCLEGNKLKSQTNICEELANELDHSITNFTRPFFYSEKESTEGFEIVKHYGVVGGTLVEIRESGEYGGYDNYLFTLRGKNKEKIMLPYLTSVKPLPYSTGQFYKFNLSALRLNGYLSGFFLGDQETLIPINCS